jgi:hypothetical protein
MTEPFLWITGAGGALATLLYVLRVARKGLRVFDALATVVDRELTPNGGGSLHDKITRTDKALTEHLEIAQRDHDDLQDVMRHLGLR